MKQINFVRRIKNVYGLRMGTLRYIYNKKKTNSSIKIKLNKFHGKRVAPPM